MTTFVYEGIEVRQTGRFASKEITGMRSRVRKIHLVEITPVNTDDGEWKKWATEDSLIPIFNSNEKAI